MKKIRAKILNAFRDEKINLTPEQWVVLSLIYEADGSSQKELANGSFKDAPTTSRIIDHLLKKKFIRRKEVENNRRQYQVFITKSGIRCVEKATPIINEIRIAGWKGLTDRDYSRLIKILDSISENMDQMAK